MKTVSNILDIIKSITSLRETGRLEINAFGTPGTLLFHEGKLVDARLGSLSGFPAVNAAVSLQDVEINFDHVEPASHASTITPNERLILSRFFGIEAADMQEPQETREQEIDWNPAPEPVVPLASAETIPTSFFSSRLVIAVCLALLLGVAAGAIVLRSKVQTLRQTASATSAAESQPAPVPEALEDMQQVADERPSATSSQLPVIVSAKPRTPASSESPSQAVATTRPEANVQNLNGQWRVINTVEKTAYQSFGNMQVGFHLTINQNGKEFTARGVKFSENGQTLPTARRTPIQVKGSIDGDKVVATFTEDGRMRRTNGRFVWKLQNDGDGLSGTFVSSAAKSSGRSAVTKEQ
ncbi:MAG TPA: hypothetical protein VJP89_02875 [Pyrinomonadaceae bacterium]|nr:hypothetical protein [Pyrinomonadaceae bacterium]